jgi:hypothetical protein
VNITLNSGRKIAVVELRQSQTYYGVLAGSPDRRANNANIERALDRAVEIGPAGCKPYLIPPVITIRQRNSRGESTTVECLPAITCAAVFDSSELARAGSEPYSSAVLVWFQDEYGPPIAEAMLEKIKALDWESIALDWIW